jgi:hypothetical protein
MLEHTCLFHIFLLPKFDKFMNILSFWLHQLCLIFDLNFYRFEGDGNRCHWMYRMSRGYAQGSMNSYRYIDNWFSIYCLVLYRLGCSKRLLWERMQILRFKALMFIYHTVKFLNLIPRQPVQVLWKLPFFSQIFRRQVLATWTLLFLSVLIKECFKAVT